MINKNATTGFVRIQSPVARVRRDRGTSSENLPIAMVDLTECTARDGCR